MFHEKVNLMFVLQLSTVKCCRLDLSAADIHNGHRGTV